MDPLILAGLRLPLGSCGRRRHDRVVLRLQVLVVHTNLDVGESLLSEPLPHRQIGVVRLRNYLDSSVGELLDRDPEEFQLVDGVLGQRLGEDDLLVRRLLDFALENVESGVRLRHAILTDLGVNQIRHESIAVDQSEGLLVRQTHLHGLTEQLATVCLVLASQLLDRGTCLEARTGLRLELIFEAGQLLIEASLRRNRLVESAVEVLDLDGRPIEPDADFGDRVVDLLDLIVERGRQLEVASEVVEPVLAPIQGGG